MGGGSDEHKRELTDEAEGLLTSKQISELPVVSDLAYCNLMSEQQLISYVIWRKVNLWLSSYQKSCGLLQI